MPPLTLWLGHKNLETNQGPVVQSIVSLTSLLVVKMLTVLVRTICNSQILLLKKNLSTFCKCKSYSHFFSAKILAYRIRPNYHTVRLGFSKLLGTLSGGKICIYLLRIHYKNQKRTYLMMIIRFFLTFFIKAYVVGAHLNCMDKSMQFKWVPTTYAFIKK